MPATKRPVNGEPVAVRLTLPILERIDAIAADLGEPRSVVIRHALRAGIRHLSSRSEA